MDSSLPRVDAAQLIQATYEPFQHLQIIGISRYEERSAQRVILEAGAFRCLSKNTPVARIADAIRLAYEAAHPSTLLSCWCRLWPPFTFMLLTGTPRCIQAQLLSHQAKPATQQSAF
jgi:DNA-binding NarL/FixJ family response regulator